MRIRSSQDIATAVLFVLGGAGAYWIGAGKLYLLNINYPTRSPDWPDTPTRTELGVKGADEPIWYSIFAPGGTPQPIVDKLNAKCVELAKTDDMLKRMRDISVVVPSQSPAEMAGFLKKDFAAHDELCRAANVKLE
jgi:tripartite-type tricarboxylate transporter receptor subunit TctC